MIGLGQGSRGAKDKPLPLYQSASPGQTATKNRKTNQVIVFDASVPNSFLCEITVVFSSLCHQKILWHLYIKKAYSRIKTATIEKRAHPLSP
jgi:hypothetical protein